ncbi:MAG: hypothetical protein MUQ43_08505 [Reinekea forsetii]|nr:hypothetical protein [Reinekea forsetii]
MNKKLNNSTPLKAALLDKWEDIANPEMKKLFKKESERLVDEVNQSWIDRGITDPDQMKAWHKKMWTDHYRENILEGLVFTPEQLYEMRYEVRKCSGGRPVDHEAIQVALMAFHEVHLKKGKSAEAVKLAKDNLDDHFHAKTTSHKSSQQLLDWLKTIIYFTDIELSPAHRGKEER